MKHIFLKKVNMGICYDVPPKSDPKNEDLVGNFEYSSVMAFDRSDFGSMKAPLALQI
jgi:hypothetical protein